MGISSEVGLRLLSSGQTDVGRVRRNNEDAFLCVPELGLFAVADGMGGHAGGEVASELAIQALQRAVATIPDQQFVADQSLHHRRDLLAWLSKTVSDINAEIFARGSADPALRGMGCTLDVALVRGRGMFLAHVGDSRAYGLLGGTLYQLTEDHTFGQTLLSGGAMTAEEVARHPQRNLLMRALGVYPKVEVDTAYLDVAPGDVFLLCSDGVYGLVDAGQIERLLKSPCDSAADRLVQAAVEAGGRDNATAVVVQVSTCTESHAIRVGSEEVRRAMAAASLFADFTHAELLRIQQIAIGRVVAPGEHIIRKGEFVSEIFLVLDGGVSVWNDNVRSGWHGPGDPFGELSLHPAESLISIKTELPSRILVFPLDEVQHLIRTDTAIGAKLALNALKRVWQRFQQLAKLVATLRSGSQ